MKYNMNSSGAEYEAPVIETLDLIPDGSRICLDSISDGTLEEFTDDGPITF